MGNGKRRVRELRMIEKESYRALWLTERGGPARRIRLQPIKMVGHFSTKMENISFFVEIFGTNCGVSRQVST